MQTITFSLSSSYRTLVRCICIFFLLFSHVLAVCGDDVWEIGVEHCDDGNTVDDGNGCGTTCQCTAGRHPTGAGSCEPDFMCIG